jgi:hypothetical protein
MAAYKATDVKRKLQLAETVRQMAGQNPTFFEENPGIMPKLALKYLGAGGDMKTFDNFMVNALSKSTLDLSERMEAELSKGDAVQYQNFRGIAGFY